MAGKLAGMPAAFESLEHRTARLSAHFGVRRPEQSGRRPVLIMLHGCGGIRPFMADIARVAVEAGAAAIVVDSYAPRRISRVAAFATVCTGARLQGRERAGDLYAAYSWARRQDFIDPERIAVAGWSHGGWTILDALALRPGTEMERATGLGGLPDEPLAGVAATFIVYPYAGVASLAGKRDWRVAPRSVAIVAGRDHIVGVDVPRRALHAQRLRGAPIEIHAFETCTHAFEDAEAEDIRIRFDAGATAHEHHLLRELIAAI